MSTTRPEARGVTELRRPPKNDREQRRVPLTRSERDVFERVIAGESNQRIAERRGTSLRTVANQIAVVFRKVGVGSRRELCAVASVVAVPMAGAVNSVTAREKEVATLAARGCSNKAIAHELGLAPSTVGVILMRVSAKLGVTSPRGRVRVWLHAAAHAESDDAVKAGASHLR